VIYATLNAVLTHLDTCLPGSALLQKLIVFCGETPSCANYIAVSSTGVVFTDDVSSGAGSINRCASILMLPIEVAVSGVCIPQPNNSGGLPTLTQETNAREAAYQQMENLAGCLSTLLSSTNTTIGNCTYATRPEITCDIEGTAYMARATFSLNINCLEIAPTITAPCC